MTQLKNIIDELEKWAPKELAEDWDTVGLEIGTPESDIKNVLITLDITPEILTYISKEPIDLVITHHPIFFRPLKNIDLKTDMGKIIQTFIKTNTSLYTMHTNLDAASGGVNDELVKLYKLDPDQGRPIQGLFGKQYTFETPKSLSELKNTLPCQIKGDLTQSTFTKIGFLGGSGHGLLKSVVKENIELFITGEINYHDEIFCKFNHITVLTLGHKESEDPVLEAIKRKLNTAFSKLTTIIKK